MNAMTSCDLSQCDVFATTPFPRRVSQARASSIASFISKARERIANRHSTAPTAPQAGLRDDDYNLFTDAAPATPRGALIAARRARAQAILHSANVVAFPQPAKPRFTVANDTWGYGIDDLEHLHSARDALYNAPQTDRPSTQMRLAAHTMNTTLIIVALPVGAAVLTYSLLRGEDMRVTARLTTLSGLALAILATPFGQSISNLL